jgi:3-oxoadipate enol-lactonase
VSAVPLRRDIADFEQRAAHYDEGRLGLLHHQISDQTAALARSVSPAPGRVLDVGTHPDSRRQAAQRGRVHLRRLARRADSHRCGDRHDVKGKTVVEFVSTEQGRFAVNDAGPREGRPVVLVAGLGDDHASWESVLPYLAPEYRCVTFDNRGIGLSPITPGPYSMAGLAADAHALHQALQLQPCIAIGSSMGGAICQEWALRYPADVTALVLSNTWGRTDPFLRVLFEHWTSLATEASVDHLLDSLLLFSTSAAYLAEHPETVAAFRASPAPDLDGFKAAAAACWAHDTLPRVGEAFQPTLVLAGRHDILTRKELSEELADAIPDAQLQLLDAGHMTFWEAPEAWGHSVTHWLKAHELR